MHMCHLSPDGSNYESKNPQLSLHHVTDNLCSYWERVTGRDKVTLLKISLMALERIERYFASYITKESERAACSKYTVQQLCFNDNFVIVPRK